MFIQNLKTESIITEVITGPSYSYLPANPGSAGQTLVMSSSTTASWATQIGGGISLIEGANIDITGGEGDATIALANNITVPTINVGTDSDNIEYTLPAESDSAGLCLGVPDSGKTLAWRNIGDDLAAKSGGISLRGLSITSSDDVPSVLYKMPTSLTQVSSGQVLSFNGTGAELLFISPSAGGSLPAPSEELASKLPMLVYSGTEPTWQKNIYQPGSISADDQTANRMVLGENNYSMQTSNTLAIGYANSLSIPNTATPADLTLETIDLAVTSLGNSAYNITGFVSPSTKQYSAYLLSQVIGVGAPYNENIEGASAPILGHLQSDSTFTYIAVIISLNDSDTSFSYNGPVNVPEGASLVLRCVRFTSKTNYTDNFNGGTVDFSNTTIIGVNNTARHNNTTVIGTSNISDSHSCAIIGHGNRSGGYNNVVVGNNSNASVSDCVLLGTSQSISYSHGCLIGYSNNSASQCLSYNIDPDAISRQDYKDLLTQLVNQTVDISAFELYKTGLFVRYNYVIKSTNPEIGVAGSNTMDGNICTIVLNNNFVLSSKLQNITYDSTNLGQFVTSDYDVRITYISDNGTIVVTIDNITVYDNGAFVFTTDGTNISAITVICIGINPDAFTDTSFIGGSRNIVNSISNVVGSNNTVSDFSKDACIYGSNNEIVGVSPETAIIGTNNIITSVDTASLTLFPGIMGYTNTIGCNNNLRGMTMNVCGTGNATSLPEILILGTNVLGNNTSIGNNLLNSTIIGNSHAFNTTELSTNQIVNVHLMGTGIQYWAALML